MKNSRSDANVVFWLLYATLAYLSSTTGITIIDVHVDHDVWGNLEMPGLFADVEITYSMRSLDLILSVCSSHRSKVASFGGRYKSI